MPPFAVLHVCMGNIARSPMAERLLALAMQQRLAKLDAATVVSDLMQSASAGTGGWHEGEEMTPSAARQIRLRGGSDDGFVARKLRTAHLAAADLILAATADQLDYVHALLPDAVERAFVLRHLNRLLPGVDAGALPPASTEPQAFADRAAALVAAVNRVRGDIQASSEDDLDDPWGRGDQTFARIADDIDETMYALVDVLLPAAPKRA
ncbi:MAG TPA: phosphotyrosine protein phosphatase [Actinoplanes sp.]|nr:phosphotyrosine protein phosphatase [Actinoplanes sp.]